MRMLLLCGLLAMPMAQAEKLSESAVHELAAKIRVTCMRAPINADFSKETHEEMCSCAERSYASHMSNTEFSSVRHPSNEDRERAGALEEKAIKECYVPLVQRNVEKSALADCLADPKAFAETRKLAAPQVKSVCSCAASSYSKALDLMEAGRAADKNAAANKAAAAWLASLKTCAANKP